MKNSINRAFKRFTIIALIILAVFFLFSIFFGDIIDEITYSNMVNKLKKDEIELVIEEPPFIIIKTKDNSFYKARMISNRLSDDNALQSLIKSRGIDIRANDLKNSPLQNILWIILFLPTILFFFFMLYLMTKRGKTSVFSGANIKSYSKKRTNITFKDVAGLYEAKYELQEMVDFLRDPRKFKKVGARIPKGVLLMGRPGTGKTLLAKAVAGEAGVSFFNASGSQFVEMFAGMGASRVRALFAKAKASAPSIIFIDEIDTIGSTRNNSSPNNGEKDQTLNQLLVEMDGFESESNVIVIGATNRETILDKALLRAGRFDRQIVVNEPAYAERLEILKIHSKTKPIDCEICLEKIAKKTSGFVGSELENILNEAAILAARNNRSSILKADINEAIDRVVSGPERKTKIMTKKEKEMVAYHEAGHALIAYKLPGSFSINKISIVPRGRALGYVLSLPNEEKNLWTKSDFLKHITISLGGRAAEEIIFNEPTAGASSDIESATKIANGMYLKYGMSDELGLQDLTQSFSYFGSNNNRVLSESYKAKIDESIKSLLKEKYEEAKSIISDNIKELELIANHLIEHEVIYEEEVADIIGSN